MKLKIAVTTVLILLVLTYTTAFIGDPFIFIILLPFALMASLFFILLSGLSVIWMLLPFQIKERLGKCKTRFYLAILCCVIFFFTAGWAINHYYLPDKFSQISLADDLGVLLFTILFGMSLIKPSNKRILLAAITGTLLLLFIFIFAYVENNEAPKTHFSAIEALKTLPYLSYVVGDKNTDKEGVTIYKRGLCDAGINIYNSNGLPGAYLLDMSGNILHTWLPEKSPVNWEYVEMCDNGDLSVIVGDIMLMRLDWNSNVKWVQKMRFHHDIAIDTNKDIYALARNEEVVFYSLLLLRVNVKCCV